METVLIQINNSKAYKLQQDLEKLHLIKVLKTGTQSRTKLSGKYKEVFSQEDAKNFNECTQAIRNDW